MAIQNFFTSRDNNLDGNTYVGQLGRLWYNPDTNSIYASDGSTVGGIPVDLATGANAVFNNISVNTVTSDDSTEVIFNDSISVQGDVTVQGNISPAGPNKIGGIQPGPGVDISNTGLLTIDSANLSFSFGNFTANNNILTIVNADEDMILATQGDAEIQLVGNVGFYKTNGLPPNPSNRYFEATDDGQVKFLVSNTDPLLGAVEIIGSTTGNSIAPGIVGTMLHVTGQLGDPCRLYYDGNDDYVSWVARRWNGNVTSPTQVLAGQDVLRINATAATDAGVGNVAMVQISATALENQTTTAQGSELTFTVTPIGQPATNRVDVATITVANGVTATKFTTTGNVTAGNVLTSTVGSTADLLVSAGNGLVDIRATSNVVIKSDSANYEWLFDNLGVLTTPGDIDLGGRLTATTGQLNLEPANNPNAYIQLNDTGDSLFGAAANLSILTNGDSYEWVFGSDAALTAPGDLLIAGRIKSTTGTLNLESSNNSNAYIQLEDTTDSIIGSTNGFIVYTSGDSYTFQFGSDGNLTVPGEIVLEGGTAFISAGADFVGIYADASQNNGIEVYTTNTEIFNTGNVNITANVAGTGKTWTFDNTGTLTAPGNVATTANISGGNILTSGLISTTANIAAGNISVTGAAAITGNVTAGNVNSYVVLPAGTTSKAPLVFTSGSILNTSAPGAVNYDGRIFYATPQGQERGLLKAAQTFVLNADYTLTDQTAVQSMFGVAAAVSSATRYAYVVTAVIYKTDNNITMSYAIDGTATLARHTYQTLTTATAALATVSTPSVVKNILTTGFDTGVIVTASLNGTGFYSIQVVGTINVTTGGTWNPLVAFSGLPGAGSYVAAGSSIEIYPIGATGANVAIGNWT